jgi:hypothetical protein
MARLSAATAVENAEVLEGFGKFEALLAMLARP